MEYDIVTFPRYNFDSDSSDIIWEAECPSFIDYIYYEVIGKTQEEAENNMIREIQDLLSRIDEPPKAVPIRIVRVDYSQE